MADRVDPLLNARLTGYTRPGFAAMYHAYRPRPPRAIVDLLMQLARSPKPRLVVDLGSGTGLSTAIWSAHAETVIGVEPLDEMREFAATKNVAANVRFEAGVASETGIPDGAVDIVTCAQSLHDMEPQTAFAEIARLLRPGGVFAAYDYDWPPIVHWQAEQAFFTFVDRIGELRRRYGIRSQMQQWDKADHLQRMRESGHFRYTRETFLHSTEPCSADRWVGSALTLGFVPPVLELGLDEREVGLVELRQAAQEFFGLEGLPWHVSYSVRLGVT